MGKRELVALLSWSSWCLLIVVWFFFAVPLVCDSGISRAYSLTIFGKLLKFHLNRKWHEISRTIVLSKMHSNEAIIFFL